MRIKLSHDKSIFGDEHITGRVGGRARPIQKEEADEQGRVRKSLDVPISRNGRPVSVTGLITFHLCNTPVRTSCIDAGKLGSAGHHDKYLSREDAVPLMPDKTAIGAEGQGNYIERESATEAVDGKPVILSNISEDPSLRADFHAKAEKMERAACGKTRKKKIKLDVRGNPEFFRNLVNDPELPAEVREAISADLAAEHRASADPLNLGSCASDQKTDWVTVEPDDVRKVRQCLERLGWKKNNKRWSATACFDQGSSPQVYQRIEGELPIELSLEGRVAALQQICRIFEVDGLPYVAVLHAPDELNDPANVHFHILYYSRPAALMTQDREKHFAPHALHAGNVLHKNADFVAPKVERQMELRREAWPPGEPLPEEYEGKWDFEVAHRYKSGKRSYKTTYPFRQKKSRRVVSAEWFADLRNHVAKSINDELVSAGLKPKLHPGSFKDLAIEKTPETKLFKDQWDRELRGIPTVAGIENERCDWDYRISELERRKKTEQQLVTDHSCKLAAKFNSVDGRTAASIAAFEAAMVKYRVQREIAIQANFESDVARQYLERLRSRPSIIIKRNTRIVRSAEKDIRALGSTTSKKLAAAEARKAKAERAIGEAQECISVLFAQIGQAVSLPERKSEDAENARRSALSAVQKLRQILKQEPELVASAQPEPEPEPVRDAGGRASPITTNPEASLRPTSRIVYRIREKPPAPAPGDLFARELLGGKRRLRQKSSGHVVPVTFKSPAEKLLTGDAHFLARQLELQEVKLRQDKRVANIVEYLTASRDGLQLSKPDAEPISRRYELKVNVPSYRTDFVQFGDDPQIIAAVESAIDRTRQEHLDEVRRDEEELAEKRRISAANEARWIAQKAAAAQHDESLRLAPVSQAPAVQSPLATSRAAEAVSSTANGQISTGDDGDIRSPTLHPKDEQDQSRQQNTQAGNSRANNPDLAKTATKSARDIEVPPAQAPNTFRDGMPSAEPTKGEPAGQDRQGGDERDDRTYMGGSSKSDEKPVSPANSNKSPDRVEPARLQDVFVHSNKSKADPAAMQSSEGTTPGSSSDNGHSLAATTNEQSAKSSPVAESMPFKPQVPLAKSSQIAEPSSGGSAAVDGSRHHELTNTSSGPAEVVNSETDPLLGSPYRRNSNGKLVLKPIESGPTVGGAREVTEDIKAIAEAKKYAKMARESEPTGHKAFKPSPRILAAMGADNKTSSVKLLERGIHPLIDRWMDADQLNDRGVRRACAAAIRKDKDAFERVLELNAPSRARFQRDWDANEVKPALQAASGRDGLGIGEH